MQGFDVKSGDTAKLSRVEGELRVGRNATLKAETGEGIVVTGGAYFEGPVDIECDFECQSMKVEGRGFGPGGNAMVRGNLRVNGSADVDASMKVKGEVKCGTLDVGGHLESLALASKSVRVGGHMKVRGNLDAETVDVGGHLTVSGDVNLTDLRVGGHARVGGGKIGGEIKVRGHFTADRAITYGQVQVFGRLRLPAGSTGERMSALGIVEFEGDAACKVLDVKGVARVGGGCVADEVHVNGKLDVSNSLSVSKKLEIYGTTDVGERVECGGLTVGGRLVAQAIMVSGDAELAGDVETSKGLRAKSVAVGGGTKCRGPLVGERVELGRSKLVIADWQSHWAGQSIAMRGIGRMTSAEDIYGKEVVLGSYSRCGRVFANRVELDKGCIVDQVTYTDEFKTPPGNHLNRPPVKTTRLPEPPI